MHIRCANRGDLPLHIEATPTKQDTISKSIATEWIVIPRVLVTDRGVIVEHGPPAEFFDNASDPRTKEFLSQIL